jgi:hypothetical protein
MERTLNLQNIDSELRNYMSSIGTVGHMVHGLKGVELFRYLKREKVKSGPYPHVTLFEAANRIMTDLVILKGIKWLLDTRPFPFDEYVVEYGNENNNVHDISANKKGFCLYGEAFNVAPSFFQVKKSSALKKLRSSHIQSDYKLIIANSDAINNSYSPKVQEGEFYVFVDVESGESKLISINQTNEDASSNIHSQKVIGIS